jgi:predicted 3-demethylubiquinone-9 3-methyltransferase (glyoxalase superfamily)
VDFYWNALREGWREPQACGCLNHRWGVRLADRAQVLGELMASSDRAKSRRVTDSILSMVKLDIATLEKAAWS